MKRLVYVYKSVHNWLLTFVPRHLTCLLNNTSKQQSLSSYDSLAGKDECRLHYFYHQQGFLAFPSGLASRLL